MSSLLSETTIAHRLGCYPLYMSTQVGGKKTVGICRRENMKKKSVGKYDREFKLSQLNLADQKLKAKTNIYRLRKQR